jgi:hypothetical protein
LGERGIAALSAAPLPPPGRAWLRATAAAAAVAAAALLLPGVPAAVAALLCLAIGAAIALPHAHRAAVARGHALTVLAAGGVLRRWTGGGFLRVAVCGAAGALAAAVLMLGLASGGPAAWIAAAAAIPATFAALALLGPGIRREAAGPHGLRWSNAAAAAAAGAVVLVLALLLGLAGLGADPAGPAPAAVSPLVAEALAAMRLAAGIEAWLAGRAVALGLGAAWAEAALLVATQAAAAAAAVSLVLAAAMPPAEWRRARGPASDAAAPPPPAPGALAAAALVAAGMLAGALWLDARLASLPAGERPVARLQIAAERIGAALYRPGTIAALEREGAAAAARDAAIRAALPGAIEAGFDAMAANVEPFLDAHYSLWGEYARLAAWAAGDLEARLARDLEAALLRGDPMRPVEALLAEAAALGEDAARAAGLADRARLDAAGLNPARLRIIETRPARPAWPRLATPGFATTLPERLGVAAAGGTLAALLAGRIARGLTGRGLARLLGSTLALPAAVAIDWALIRLEEARHRDTLRAEILAAIEAARAEALAALR